MATGNIAVRLGEQLQDSPQKTNFMKLTRLLICGGTVALRELFDSRILPRDLTNKLRDPSVCSNLEKLRKMKKLTKDQWNILYPPPGAVVESKLFDISLLFKLLRNICRLTAPENGWDDLPNSTDTTLEADLVRVKYYRNTIYAHVTNDEMNEDEFEIYWREIKEAILRILSAINPASRLDCEGKIDEYYATSVAGDDDKNLMLLKIWCMEEEIAKNTTRMEEFDKQVKELRDAIQGNATTAIVYPEITIQAVIKLASRGAWMAGSVYILNHYKHDPDTFLKMVKGFVLPSGVLVYAMTGGSLRLHARAETLDGLEHLWKRYQTGRLREDLENMLLHQSGLEDLADGDVIEVEVTLSEEEYKRAREILKGLQHSDEDGHEDSHSRYDKDDPAKSTEAANHDPDETMEEAKRERGNETANKDPEKKTELQSPTLRIVHGKQFKDRESIFQIHLAFVTSQEQANQAVKKLEKKSTIADASYRIHACRIFNEERKSFKEDCDDFWPMSAGARLLRLLEMTDARNVVAILTCWHKGVFLEPQETLFSQRALDLLCSSGLFQIKTPSKEEVLKEVGDYFELIKQQVAQHPFIIPEQEFPNIKISHGKTIEDKQSMFQAHLAVISSAEQVEKVLAELKKDPQVSKATYNAYAYRILEKNKSWTEDFDDDGENFAGACLLHLLQEIRVRNVMVIVTRWHSRIALGRTRFKLINQTALELLHEAGLVKLTSTESQQLLKKQEKYLEHMKQHGASRPRANLQDKIKIIQGEKLEDRKSSFQAHLAVISSRDQVDQVLKQLKKDQDVANATYNIQAYRIHDKHRCSVVQDCDDGGEYLAGASLLHLLQVLDVENVMVVVSRWHGGIWLGHDRFKHIHQCALQLLQLEGLVKNLMPGQEQELLAKLNKYFDFAKRNTVDYYKEIPKSSCPKIIHGACIEDRKSTFQAHLAVVTSRDQVEQVLAEIKKNWLVAKATYNISAYRIFDKENESYIEDFDDDGETRGGESLLHQLQQAGAKNVVAVVTRWHGDILLGSSRFHHINKCVNNLLELPALVY